VLDAALDTVSEAVAAFSVGVGGCDVAVERRGSGCELRGWGLRWSAVGRPGRECRRTRGTGGRFEAGEEVFVVVVDVVGNVDGGCAAIVSGNVAAFTETGGLVTGAVGAGGSPQACEAVSQVLGSSVDVPVSLSGRGGSLSDAVCITALTVAVEVVWEAVDCRSRSSFACVAISWVLDFFGVPLAFTPFIILSNPSFATRYPSSRPKSIPLSIPSSIPNFLPFFTPNFSPSSIARSQSSLRFAPSLVAEAQVQNRPILL
jgi:hypothetical protein